MAPLVTARTNAGRPLPFCTDSPAALFRDGGWGDAAVAYPGQPPANFGRLPPYAGDAGRGTNLRTHLVTATL